MTKKAKKMEDEFVKEVTKFFKEQGIDVRELEKERKVMKEKVRKLDRRLQSALNQRRYVLSSEKLYEIR